MARETSTLDEVATAAPEPPPAAPREPVSRTMRALIVLVGLLVPQFVLIGPSLLGRKVLLPLDILQSDPFYLPVDRTKPPPRPHDVILSDPVLQLEIFRR